MIPYVYSVPKRRAQKTRVTISKPYISIFLCVPNVDVPFGPKCAHTFIHVWKINSVHMQAYIYYHFSSFRNGVSVCALELCVCNKRNIQFVSAHRQTKSECINVEYVRDVIMNITQYVNRIYILRYACWHLIIYTFQRKKGDNMSDVVLPKNTDWLIICMFL